MIVYPNCKINLGLNVTKRRSDGYHNLETVFYPIDLCDILEIIIAIDGITEFSSSGIEIPGETDTNLCLKAYQLLAEQYKLPAVKIHLHKIIPIGAGLGGGSSDASSTLISLNQMFKLGISEKELLGMAAELGADCPFFILNEPQFATSIGNEFENITIDLHDYSIVLVKPDFHINTAKAYSLLHPAKKTPSLFETIKMPISNWRNKLYNDFEDSIMQLHPEIKKIKEKLYDHGAVYASMSGSGSSVFGLFKNEIERPEEFSKYFVWQKKLN